jgi:hypothetical protein
MARLLGFEPRTYGLEVRCSIQLSYRRTLILTYLLLNLLYAGTDVDVVSISTTARPFHGDAFADPSENDRIF